MAALREMKARGDVDLVIVETSGLADPLALTWMIGRPDLADVARLDAVVTVVDLVAWEKARTTEEWQAQIRCADLIVLAKTDLGGDRAGLAKAIEEAGGGARVVDGGAELPIDLLLDVAPDPAAVAERASGRAEARHSGFHAVSFADAGSVYVSDRVEDFVEALPEAVFRAKGVVRVGESKWARFHAVGGRVDFDPDVPAPGHGETRVVFLGPRLGEADVQEAWRSCRAR
jgi:G3E family GTPase